MSCIQRAVLCISLLSFFNPARYFPCPETDFYPTRAKPHLALPILNSSKSCTAQICRPVGQLPGWASSHSSNWVSFSSKQCEL
ncbi:hypothetical protein P280DRAFT_241421 [Massarina eburnea CBS 473.64]|uniref:Secreted protein n=1 Tax=Massarina eburnea CBS 473.64 TaxID=1395130 RepID=A0A6A6S5T3_9PLEO|nr:hypothetical protein P280DRAFT_241421 [Massarina eburnea CBS 473.64]